MSRRIINKLYAMKINKTLLYLFYKYTQNNSSRFFHSDLYSIYYYNIDDHYDNIICIVIRLESDDIFITISKDEIYEIKQRYGTGSIVDNIDKINIILKKCEIQIKSTLSNEIYKYI